VEKKGAELKQLESLYKNEKEKYLKIEAEIETKTKEIKEVKDK